MRDTVVMRGSYAGAWCLESGEMTLRSGSVICFSLALASCAALGLTDAGEGWIWLGMFLVACSAFLTMFSPSRLAGAAGISGLMYIAQAARETTFLVVLTVIFILAGIFLAVITDSRSKFFENGKPD